MKIMLLGSYTSSALKGLLSGSDRKAAVDAMLAQVGGTLDQFSFTRGDYDVFVGATVPDGTSLPGIATALRASGAFEKATALEEVNIDEVLDVARKVSGAYSPAG
jgi:uncharacterized protein with GYD domain